MIESILNDISSKLNIEIDKNKIKYFKDGVSDSIVFKYEKYLIKTVDIKELDAYLEFFRLYKEPCFQKVICYSKELLYICFSYIEGTLFKENILDSKLVVEELYKITSNYREYKYDAYGYLEEEDFTWIDFLMDEAYRDEDKIGIDYKKLFDSFEVIKKYDAPKYLLHGDFGTHNFIVNNGKIYAIDPIPLVGDYLYDFYFGIFTDVKIFKDLDVDYILSFFDREYEYKKTLMIICFFIRLRRASKYDKENINIYIDYINKL
ncbi:MAG: hypothetical protein J6O56_03105 [Bacilli bacterium]|nr:hypothetical protein [Bacilli bacterium]